jgi:hypothetical protein
MAFELNSSDNISIIVVCLSDYVNKDV